MKKHQATHDLEDGEDIKDLGTIDDCKPSIKECGISDIDDTGDYKDEIVGLDLSIISDNDHCSSSSEFLITEVRSIDPAINFL